MADSLVKDALAEASYDLPKKSISVVGRIFSIKKTKHNTFVILKDGTGTIQCVFEHSKVATDSMGLSQDARFRVIGQIDLTRFKDRATNNAIPSIMVEDAELISKERVPYREVSIDADFYSGHFRRSVILSRLRRIAAQTFRAKDFVEVEPKLITLSGGISGLEPLRVNYVGFGAPAYLWPSPAAQLRQFLLGADIEAVFCVSRIFTTTFRDEVTSNEALTAMGLRITPAEKKFDNELSKIALALFEDKWLRSSVRGNVADEKFHIPVEEIEANPEPIKQQYSSMRIERYSNPVTMPPYNDGQTVVLFERLIAPPRTILAERSFVSWSDGWNLETTTLHLERFVSMLNDVPLRNIASSA